MEGGNNPNFLHIFVHPQLSPKAGAPVEPPSHPPQMPSALRLWADVVKMFSFVGLAHEVRGIQVPSILAIQKQRVVWLMQVGSTPQSLWRIIGIILLEEKACASNNQIWGIMKNYHPGLIGDWRLQMYENYTRWWFRIFIIFIPTWGNDPIWLIFFKGVETNN